MTKRERSSLKTLSEYQRSLERFENYLDMPILPDLFLIVRVDARRAGNEWDAVAPDAYPYGEEIVDAFIDTGRRMFSMGLRCIFAFIHGDEVSLLIDPTELSNARRRQKLVSLLASAASVGFMKASGLPVYFHAKISELPTAEHAVDYFLWQRKVAARNYYSSGVRRILISRGQTPGQIDERLAPLNENDRRALAGELGMDLGAIPDRVRTGVGIWWDLAGQVPTLNICESLPDDEQIYAQFVRQIVASPGAGADVDPDDVPWRKVASTDGSNTTRSMTGRSQTVPQNGNRFRIQGAVPVRAPFRTPASKSKVRKS